MLFLHHTGGNYEVQSGQLGYKSQPEIHEILFPKQTKQNKRLKVTIRKASHQGLSSRIDWTLMKSLDHTSTAREDPSVLRTEHALKPGHRL